MTKSFKKAIACMLAVLMVAFSVPFSALASQTVAQYHPDLELQFGALFDPDAGDYAPAVSTTPSSGNILYSSLYAPALDATFTKDTTNGGINVTQLKFTASKYAAYNDFWNEYAELEGDDAVPAPTEDHILEEGDYFWLTARLDNVDVTTYISAVLTYSNNIEPAGYYEYKPKTKTLTEWHTLSSAKAADVKNNGKWNWGGPSPIADLSANAIFPGLNATEYSTCQPMIENDGATGRMFIAVLPDEGDPIATPASASPDEDWTFANPTTGALNYEYDESVICATWCFKVVDEISAQNPISFGLYNPNDRIYYDDEETIEYELGGGHEGGSYTQEDVPMPSTYATYAPEQQTPASEKFLIFGMNIHSGEGTGGDTPHEHSYTSAITTPATCTEAGVMTYTCECGDSYTEPIPALGHSWDAGVETPATCTEAGYITYTCTRGCGATDVQPGAAATGHSWGQWIETTAPTCVDAGEETRTCSACNATETQPVAATGIHTYESVVTPATCTEAGYTTFTCSVCGDNYTEPGDAALGHDWGEWATITPATEESTGLKKRECSRCDAFEEEEIPKLDHTHTPGQPQEENRVEPTCTVAGSYDLVVRCSTCGEIISSTPQTIPATGHDLGEWEVITAATCTDAGEKARSCSKCDFVETETIPAEGHDYQSVVTAPTCTEGGYTTYTCSKCQDSYTADEVPANGHNMGEWAITKQATKTAKGEKTRACSNCDFTETEEIASLPILVTVKGSEYGTVSGDFTVAGADVTQEYTFGQQYQFTATAKEGYKFDGWKIGGKNVTSSATYKSKAYADVTIEAIYSKAESESFDVIFYDLYKNVVKQQTVSSAAEIEAPTASQMARSGFVFKGWNKNLETITGATEITGVYEPDTESGYTVTVVGADNATIDGAAATVKENVPYDSKVTVSAEGVKGWKIGETVVSTSESYTFYVGSNVTVTAVYDDVEAVPAITIVNVKPIVGSDYKYQFIATRVVPDGYKVEKVGFVYGKNLADDELTLDLVGQQGKNDNAGKIKAGYNNFTNDVLETSLSYGLTGKQGTIKAKAFMVVSKNGKQEVIYSGIESHTYTNIPDVGDDD